MITEYISNGVVLLIAIICGYFVLEYAPKESFYYKSLIALCCIQIVLSMVEWVNYAKSEVK